MTQNTFYFRRLGARLLDLLLVSLVMLLIQAVNQKFNGSFLIWYLVYNSVVVILNGRTLGKYSFSLSVKTKERGFKKALLLIIREALVLVLLPLLAFNLLLSSPIALHDRISGTSVARNEH